tara:strand:+ start:620 stop:814 length:195 start_codon:yes stop_codon:yes gene_type:complete
MDKKFKVATFILSIGIICFIAFELAGSSVDKEGILNEPFFLIPVGWVLILISIVLYIFFAITKK